MTREAAVQGSIVLSTREHGCSTGNNGGMGVQSQRHLVS